MNPKPTPIDIAINKVVTKADYAISLLSVIPANDLTPHYITLQRIQAKLAETFKAVAHARAVVVSKANGSTITVGDLGDSSDGSEPAQKPVEWNSLQHFRDAPYRSNY